MDVVNQIGRTDDGTDTDGYYNSEFFVPLRPAKRLAGGRRASRAGGAGFTAASGRAPRRS